MTEPADDKSEIAITVNGESVRVPQSSTVQSLVDSSVVAPGYLAIELNEAVVPRSEFATARLSAGDKVEVVTLVGGG